jgi:GNAT superfamily N-acetyltransferase
VRFVEVREQAAPADAVRAAMGVEGDLAALRLARGCRCFGAWAGERLVAYSWLSTGAEWIGELGLEIRPHAGEAYVWNCVTLPAHRRQGVFRNLLQCVLSAAAAEGLTRLWIGSVEDFADKAIHDAGFRPVVKFESRSLGAWRRLRIRRADDARPDDVAAALQAISLPVGARFHRVKNRRH